MNTGVTGNNNHIQAGVASLTNMYGTDNIVDFVPNSSSVVNLQQSSSSNTFNGSGNTIAVSADNTSIRATGDVIVFSQAGLTTTIAGNSNAIAAERSVVNAYGNNNTIGGTSNTINAANDSTLFVDAGGS